MDWLTDNLETILVAVAGMISTLLAWRRKSTDDERDNDRADFSATAQMLTERLDTVENRCDAQADELAKTNREVGELKASNRAKTQQIKLLTKQVEQITKERDALRRELADVRRRANHAEQTVQELRSKVEDKDLKIEALQQRIRKLEDESHPEAL